MEGLSDLCKGCWNALLIGLLCVLTVGSASAQSWPIGVWDDAIRSTLTATGIPGLAALVIVGDETPLSGGYGVRKLGESDRVAPETVFQIASLTKAVTATTVALLVDEGRLSWDDPIQRHLPEFRLRDSWVASHLTLRDAMSLRGGIPGGDSIALFSPRSRAEILEATAKLDAPLFRATFGASANLMFFLAGEVVSSVGGTSWDDFVAQRLFEPLRMTSTTTIYDRGERNPNYAWPHVRTDGRTVPRVSRPRADNVAAAAGIISNIVDWAKWVRFLLGDGALDGRQLVDPTVLAETFKPTSILTPAYQGSFNPDALLNAYGMGWVLSEYRGRTLVEHSGGLPGSSSIVALVPDENIGIVFMTNLGSGATRGPLLNLKFQILDSLLDRLDATGRGSGSPSIGPFAPSGATGKETGLL